jgi:hypothetical protein
VKKMLIATAATAIAIAPLAITTVTPAHASTCDIFGVGTVDYRNCMLTLQLGCSQFHDQANCDMLNQPAPAALPAPNTASTGFPDCDQYTVASNRAVCVDQHMTGQR